MRKTIAGLVAVMVFSAVMATQSAQACVATSPCGGYGYYGYGYHHGHAAYQRLPDPAAPQYFWVNQGPTFTGPGNFAPVPTYQERAVIGSRYYGRPYRYGYDGGPYANATHHYYDGAPGMRGPAVYSYRFRRHHPRVHRPIRSTPKYYYTKPSHGHPHGHPAAHGARTSNAKPRQHVH